MYIELETAEAGFLVLSQYLPIHISLSFKALTANWDHKNKALAY